MEDKKKELESQNSSRKEQSKLERFKNLVYKHRRKITFAIGSFVFIGGAVFFFKKNPEYGKRLMLSLEESVNEGNPEIINLKGLPENEQMSLTEEAIEALPEFVDVDLSQTFSASRLGRQTGNTAREINNLLKEHGFMEGDPGFYRPTSKGEPFCVEKFDGNGYGGYAARSWSWLEWSKDIIPRLGLNDSED